MDNPVGYGFRPFDEEIIHHLRNKIEGRNELVDGEISEANICSYDPWDLRRLYKYKTRDLVWYFFSRRDNKYGTTNRQSRTTPSGKWKLTGEPSFIKDDLRGSYFGVPQRQIGYKRVLTFSKGKNSEKTPSDWVIHEFHYDLLLEDKRTYVVCRLEYKGNDKRYLFDNPTDPTPTLAPNASEGSVVNQSRQENSGSYSTYPEYNSSNPGQWFNENFNMQQQIQGDSGLFNGLSHYAPATNVPQFGENFNLQPLVEGYSQSFPEYDLINHDLWPSDNCILQHPFPHSALYDNDTEMIPNGFNELNGYSEEMTSLQQNYSNYRPPQPVSGVFSDDSDSDSDSDSTIFGATSSSTDSIGRSNEPHHTPIHDIPSPNTIEPLPTPDAPAQPNQLNLQLQLQSKEQVKNTQQSECEWKMAEDSIRKTPSTNTVKQSWIVLEKKSQRNAKWNYLKNMIIGILLFIYIIGWIILVH